MPGQRYCECCDKWVPARQYECKECGADTLKAAPDDDRDEDYERAERSEEWERRGGGGL